MVRECIWALKMANRILTLRLQKDIGVLNSIGVDHGSSDVNKQTFTQLGIASESVEGKSTQPKTNEFNQVFEKHLHRSSEIRQLITNDVDSPVSVNSIQHQMYNLLSQLILIVQRKLTIYLEISNGLINGQTSTLILVPYVVRILLYY